MLAIHLKMLVHGIQYATMILVILISDYNRT